MAKNNIQIVISAEDKASQPLAKIAGEVEHTGKSSEEAASKTGGFNTVVGRLGDYVKGAAIAFATYKIGDAITNFAGDAFRSAAQLEQTNMAFQSLVGNTKEANSVFASLVQYANTTPFQSREIVQAAQTLMGFGTAGQQTVDIIKKLGDVTATSGGDLKALSLVTGQVFAQGKMHAQDMYQLINDGGAGVLKIMAANAGGMGKLTEEFQNGGVPAQQYFDAINQATSQGNFAFEGAAKQADTFNGRVSTLQDTVTQFGMRLIGVKIDPQLGYVMEPGGLFDKAKGIISSLNDELGKMDAKQVLMGVESAAAIVGVIVSYKLLSSTIKGVISAYSDLKAAKDWIVDVTSAALEFGKTGISVAKTWGTKAAEIAGAAKDMAVAMGGHAKSAGTSWVKSAGEAAVEWGKQLVQITKFAVTEGPKIALKALDTGAAWVINAIRMGIVWTENLAVVVAQSVITAVRATPAALATGAAWARGAATASYAWVTVELPKIVLGWMAAARAAVVHAATSSAAWVRNAAIASFAWVTTELPKIVTGFITTSTASVVQSAITSKAWVVNAAQSSTAWVITELPKIIQGFFAVAGASIIQAGIASKAWIASAAASSEAFTAFSALVATPLVMPAIGVAAALASIALVYQAAMQARDAINDANDAKMRLNAEDSSLINHFVSVYRNPNTDAHSKALAKQFLHNDGVPGYAIGTSYAPGGSAVVGEFGAERVNLPPGSEVIPAYRTRQGAGSQSSPSISITNHIYNQTDYKSMLSDIGFQLRLAS